MPFYNQENLSYVSVGKKVTFMDPIYFENCFNIQELIFEDGTEYLTLGSTDRVYSPFSRCWMIRKLYIGRNINGMLAPFSISSSFSLIYGNTVVDIRGLRNCTGLTALTISNSISSISPEKIPSEHLNKIIVAEGNPNYDSREDCNAIIETKSNSLILGVSSTKIPSSVSNIGSKAFNNCMDLYSITIPSNITEIANDAFYGCDNLTKVILHCNTFVSCDFSPSSNFVRKFGTQVHNLLLSAKRF